MGEFKEIGLKKEILDVLSSLKFKKTFEVQDKVIPLAFQKKNIVFTSRTGSGKTLTYLLGYLGKINKKQNVQMLIVVPTRELCIQVGKEMKTICDILNVNVGMLYGGREISGDYRTINKRNQIIVGTPGRLIQHVNEKNIKIGDVKYIVYDESDQMFDNGFYDDCAYLKTRISKDAQIILSSATMTEKVKNFVEHKICEYELLQIGDLIPKNIVQEKVFCKKEEKNELLFKIFRNMKFKRAMVFVNTKVKSHVVPGILEDNKFNAKALHGELTQDERKKHLNLFKEGKINILVTTDIASRGLHIEKVDIVVNYDVPPRREYYIHRIGRTGRVDMKGYSITLICPEDEDRFHNIEFEFQVKATEVDKDLKKVKKDSNDTF